jgi:hypothetical protein
VGRHGTAALVIELAIVLLVHHGVALLSGREATRRTTAHHPLVRPHPSLPSHPSSPHHRPTHLLHVLRLHLLVHRPVHLPVHPLGALYWIDPSPRPLSRQTSDWTPTRALYTNKSESNGMATNLLHVLHLMRVLLVMVMVHHLLCHVCGRPSSSHLLLLLLLPPPAPPPTCSVVPATPLMVLRVLLLLPGPTTTTTTTTAAARLSRRAAACELPPLRPSAEPRGRRVRWPNPPENAVHITSMRSLPKPD